MTRGKRKPSSPFAGQISEQLKSLAVPVQSLNLYAKNPRRGDVGALSESLRVFGQTKPIIVQASTRTVIGGNHLLRAASALGWSEIAANFVDVDDDTADAIAVADNRMAELGSFDDELLASLLAELAEKDLLEGTGYDGDDIDDLLRGVVEGDGPSSEPKELSTDPWVKPGQIYQLNKHRIICGDGKEKSVIERLMGDASPKMLLVTPPYEKDAANKNPFQAEPACALLTDLFADVQEQFWFGADAYRMDLPFGDSDGSWLVWDRRTDASDAQFGDAFEIIYSKSAHTRDILRHQYTGVIDTEVKKRGDLTPRPTPLIVEIMERWSSFDAIILAPYLDSGPSLTAAEKCGRIIYGAKASPAHVQSLLERWQDYSGLRAELLDE